MRKAELIKKMIPIYLASCLAWIHNIVYTPLGYMYNTWPNQDALIMLIAVLPGIVAMAAGVLAGKLIDLMGRKNLVVLLSLIHIYPQSLPAHHTLVSSG